MKAKNLLFVIWVAGLTFTSLAQVPNFVPSNGLLGYYPFTGNANDASFNGFHGTVEGAILTADRFGNTNSAYYFDGDSYIDLGNVIGNFGTSDFTINAWVNNHTWGYGIVVSKRQSSSHGNFFSFNTYPGFEINESDHTNYNHGQAPTAAALNSWFMFTMVREGTTVKIFQDGVEVLSVIAGGVWNINNSAPCLIGARIVDWFVGQHITGSIDDVGLWSRGLTQQEITNLFNSCLPNAGSESLSVCDSYLWAANGQTYSASGSYTEILTNAAGCDSIATLELTIFESDFITDTVSACAPYTWDVNGVIYNNSGTYVEQFLNADGCDSTRTLNLTITTINPSVTVNGIILTANEIGAEYTWMDCATQNPIQGETSQIFTPTANGDYAVIVTVGNCSVTSSCTPVTTVGIADYNIVNIKMYPNPTHGVFVVDFDTIVNNAQIVVRDVTGRVVAERSTNGQNKLDINIDENAGIYFVSIYLENDHKVLRLIKTN